MKRTYQQPQMLLNNSGMSTGRQPFDIEDPRASQLPPLSKDSFFTLLITMLFVIATVGGFVYINMYLCFDLYKVVIERKPGTSGEAMSNCSTYYCGFSAHYYVHNYASYEKCNQYICSPVCVNTGSIPGFTNFSCSNPNLDNTAYYYDCFDGCQSDAIYTNRVFPPQLFITFIVACVGGGLFGLGVLISLLYGIIGQCTNSGLSCGERLALLVNFVCPSAKYYAFRERDDWAEVKVNLKGMLWLDIIVTSLIAMALGCYIYIAIAKAFLFYEYLVTYGMGLMLLAYTGNLHRNYIEMSDFQQKLDAIRSRG